MTQADKLLCNAQALLTGAKCLSLHFPTAVDIFFQYRYNLKILIKCPNEHQNTWHLFHRNLVHLPEWTFDRKRTSAKSNLSPNSTQLSKSNPSLNPNSILNRNPSSNSIPITLKYKNVFGKMKWRQFSCKCPDTIS